MNGDKEDVINWTESDVRAWFGKKLNHSGLTDLSSYSGLNGFNGLTLLLTKREDFLVSCALNTNPANFSACSRITLYIRK